MLRLTTLGATDLRDRHGHQIREVLAQPKRAALLIYLAVESSRGPVSRDRLLGLFWPESDDARARNTLSQALHYLRQSLGSGVIESHGANAVELRGDQLWCDATVLAESFERGEVEMALDLYRGEFCSTLFVSGAPEVEQWLDAQRRRLRGLALAAARTLAERLAARGELEPAARAARRALALQPDDEREVRSLLVLLERCGDVAGALLAYQSFARGLAEAIQTQPAVETRQLVEGIRNRSERAALPAQAPAAPDTVVPVSAAVAGAAPPARSRWRRDLALVAAVAAAGIALWWAVGRRRAAPRPDPRLVAIAPFRVTGADSALAFLREGMLDLLAAELTGQGGLRAVDPRTILGAWTGRARGRISDLPDSAALRAARSVGAGRLLLGSVVGRSERLILTATLLESERPRVRAEVTLTGPLDSLPELAEALAARLLSQGAGEPAARLPSLTSASLPALKAYLDGQTAFRAGQYAAAVADLTQAVELDSSFAMAWARLVWVSDWLTDPDVRARAAPVAWSLRGRLSAPDRALLVATLGPAYPSLSSPRQLLEAWQTAVNDAPERPDAWYGLGDTYFHLGRLLDRDSGFVQAEAALARAVALDSGFTAPLAHLVQIAILRRDSVATGRLEREYARLDSTSDVAAYLRWHVALVLGDSATARTFDAALDTLPLGVLYLIAGWAQVGGVGVGTAWRAAHSALRRATGGDAIYAERVVASLSANAGHFAERLDALRRWFEGEGLRLDTLANTLAGAVWLDGDLVAGRAMLARPDFGSLPGIGHPAVCWQMLWQLWKALAPGDTATTTGLARECARSRTSNLIFRTVAASVARDTPLQSLLAPIDSARAEATGSGSGNFWSLLEGLALMDRHEYARARDAFRRREVGSGDAVNYWAPMLRLEGRAAELAGDTAGAIHAYRHYLALRYDPDPEVRFYADSARAAVRRLERRPHA